MPLRACRRSISDMSTLVAHRFVGEQIQPHRFAVRVMLSQHATVGCHTLVGVTSVGSVDASTLVCSADGAFTATGSTSVSSHLPCVPPWLSLPLTTHRRTVRRHHTTSRPDVLLLFWVSRPQPVLLPRLALLHQLASRPKSSSRRPPLALIAPLSNTSCWLATPEAGLAALLVTQHSASRALRV